MPQNSLTLVCDEHGMYYRVPICVINDPLNYDADYLAKKLVNKKAPKEVILSVSIDFNCSGSIDYLPFVSLF